MISNIQVRNSAHNVNKGGLMMIPVATTFGFLAVGLLLTTIFGGAYKTDMRFFIIGTAVVAVSLYHVGRIRFSGKPIHFDDLLCGENYRVEEVLSQEMGMAVLVRPYRKWPFEKQIKKIVAGIPVRELKKGRIIKKIRGEC
ncbi:MAG: hypothetical protein QMD77_05135 [Patescibacteria group bacterium]|nr:hypothetical protein [Patescibacteria group bacterium]